MSQGGNNEVARLNVAITGDVAPLAAAAKQAEEEAAKKRADNRVEKEKLLRILAEKQDGKLSELSVSAIQKRINALET